VSFADRSPQAPKGVTEAVEGVLAVGIRPQESGDLLAAMLNARVEDEIGQEGLSRLQGDLDAHPVLTNVELTQ
jgi:hypothetical protein